MWAFKTDDVEYWAYLDAVFSKEECEKIIALGSSLDSQKAIVGKKTGCKGSVDCEIRDSETCWIKPDEESNELYQKITSVSIAANEKFFGFDLSGFNEPLQFTKYAAPKGNYRNHIDKYFGGPIRKLSFSVVLTNEEEYEGGDFIVDTGVPTKIEQPQGRVIYFPSYVVHGVTPVTKGVRHSLVGWITGPPFK